MQLMLLVRGPEYSNTSVADPQAHICINNSTIIGSANVLAPGWCQAIIWTNGGILLIQTLATKFSEILIEIRTLSFKKMHLKMLSE